MDAHQVTSSAHVVSITHQPPRASGESVTPLSHLGGTLLAVGVTRGLRNDLSFVLPAMGVFPFHCSSDVLALELLSRGNLFDAVLIEVPPSSNASALFLSQLRERHPTIPILVVSRSASDHYVLYRGYQPESRVEVADVTNLAREIVADIVHEVAEPVCASGVLPIGSSGVSDPASLECPEITR